MKQKKTNHAGTTMLKSGLAGLVLAPISAHAQAREGLLAVLPIEINASTFVFIGALLVLSVVLFLIFQHRFKLATRELRDITAELDHTRQRLTETGQALEQTEQDLKHTSQRYQGILFDAEVGTFQMDLEGNCTYLNSAMQELSGLYPKKAQKEGLQSAIHPDDRERFNQAWEAFAKGDAPFALECRFKHAKGREVHVACRANKILDERKDVESYIGWVTDVTPFHEENLRQEAATGRYARFVEETVEGYYQLAPDAPIPLAPSADKMAETIMGKMTLVACNTTFAAMYGATPSELKGQAINALKGGCGPFKNNETLKSLIDSDYKLIDVESIRQDPRGNRLNLINNVIGLVEDNKLVGIWGMQRNISQQKCEKEELASQVHFMHRILNALPADLHVKDTRCRYLYASKKLADRTGIPQEAWVGKTIFEVMPATPRDHDKNAVDVMKSGKLVRTERPYEARGKSGWMETIQIPLVSDEGLVEGVVGLSLDITERKKKTEELQLSHQQLGQQLHLRTDELQKTQNELGKASLALRDSHQQLRVREAQLENREHEFNEQLNERKRVEEQQRRSEESLLSRQKQLEEQLSKRLAELDAETDKRKKWEELLSIKENELHKLEALSTDRTEKLEQEIARREQTEARLAGSQTELEKLRKELEQLAAERKQEFGSEHAARKQAETQLKQTEELLQKTQTRIKTLSEQHSAELEHEVAERKIATTKLIQSADELDELKQQFNQRIEQETKQLKQELAQKNIREKSLRQHEKNLEDRIAELEKALQLKLAEQSEQIQAREKSEVARSQIEQKLEQMTTRQKQLIERETQKLNLNIAEIRLEEIKLRKKADDLQLAKEDLENIVEIRTAELANANEQQQKTAAALSETQSKLEALAKSQAELVAQETKALHDELKQLKQTEHKLLTQQEQLQKQSTHLEDTIRTRSEKLAAETAQREQVEKELKELQIAFEASQDNVGALLEQHTKELQDQIASYKQNEATMQKAEESLKKQSEKLQQTIEARTGELAEARQERKKIELELAETIKRSSQGAREIEAQIAEIKRTHDDEIQRIKDEEKDLRKSEKHYRSLFQTSADAFLQLDPKTGKIEMANPSAAYLFGVDAADSLAGKTIDALSPQRQLDNSPSSDIVKARLHTAVETGHKTFEWQFQKNDQSTFHAWVSFGTVAVEDKQCILAVVNDISEIKRKLTDLEQTLAVAHAANRMNSKVVEEVDVAVQTALTPVVKTSSTIEKAENLTAEQRIDMAVINRNCRTLIDSMNYRKELSQLADGTDTLAPDICDLHKLIKTLDQQFCQRAETKKLFFAVSFAQYQSANNVPKLVETDQKKVQKTLSILLGYALANTEKGRLGLHAARKANEIENVTVSFELSFTGRSAKDELLDKVFGSDVSGTPGEAEMKYGLTFASQYIRMLGGTIDLDYRQGDVTVLTVNFPFKKVASEIVMPGKGLEKAAGAA